MASSLTLTLSSLAFYVHFYFPCSTKRIKEMAENDKFIMNVKETRKKAKSTSEKSEDDLWKMFSHLSFNSFVWCAKCKTVSKEEIV